jgi:hypothetical protein
MPKIVVHYSYGGLPLCDTTAKAPQLTEREEDITCKACYHRFMSSEAHD